MYKQKKKNNNNNKFQHEIVYILYNLNVSIIVLPYTIVLQQIHYKITGKNLARLHNLALAHIYIDFASVYEICVILNFKFSS